MFPARRLHGLGFVPLVISPVATLLVLIHAEHLASIYWRQRRTIPLAPAITEGRQQTALDCRRAAIDCWQDVWRPLPKAHLRGSSSNPTCPRITVPPEMRLPLKQQRPPETVQKRRDVKGRTHKKKKNWETVL